jgi:flagellar biosynthesis GTPase FlhF
LEQPGFPSGITPTIVPFKLLLLGKSAVGKTSTVAKLAGKGASLFCFAFEKDFCSVKLLFI